MKTAIRILVFFFCLTPAFPNYQGKVRAQAKHWIIRLALQEWNIELDFSDGFIAQREEEQKEELLALTYADPRYRRAVIVLREHEKPEIDSEHLILHELLHVRFADLDWMLPYDLSDARRIISGEEEKLTEILTRALLKKYR